MKFERTESFKGDYQKLSERERSLFASAVRVFNSACDNFIQTRDPSSWPASLRVKSVANAPGIFEMTWSFAGPDGRATWQWTTVVSDGGDLEPAVLWRRLGGHNIFREP